MSDHTQKVQNWDWLADPDVALALYSSERKAFYDWQVAEREWSEAIRDMDPRNRKSMTREQRDLLSALQNRLDEAAEAYAEARRQLHEEWSA